MRGCIVWLTVGVRGHKSDSVETEADHGTRKTYTTHHTNTNRRMKHC